MARTTYKFIETEPGVYKAVEAQNAPRRAPRSPAVFTDSMAPTWHPCDGKHYESKSAFRAVTKAHGCLEVGNESAETIIKTAERNAPDFHEGLRETIAAVARGELRDD